MNAKRIYRLYGDEGLTVRTKPRKRLASRPRVPMPAATRPNERWSMDFVSARLVDGRWFRTLTVLDLYTRESLALVADRSLTGVKVAAALSRVLQQRRGARRRSRSTTAASSSAARWMRGRTRTTSGSISFGQASRWRMPSSKASMAKLRDECLNSHVFASVDRSAGDPGRLA